MSIDDIATRDATALAEWRALRNAADALSGGTVSVANAVHAGDVPA